MPEHKTCPEAETWTAITSSCVLDAFATVPPAAPVLELDSSKRPHLNTHLTQTQSCALPPLCRIHGSRVTGLPAASITESWCTSQPTRSCYQLQGHLHQGVYARLNHRLKQTSLSD